jgi:hypothetical protein
LSVPVDATVTPEELPRPEAFAISSVPSFTFVAPR